METYKFNFNGQAYELKEDGGAYLINDEEFPVSGIEIKDILSLLNQEEGVSFEIGYFDQPCSKCQESKQKKAEYYKFLEYQFYIYTKKGEYVISSISPEYKNTTFNKLFKKGQVDNSYIVSLIVCLDCGEFSVEIEQCDV